VGAEHPFAALVRERAGVPLASPADAARLELAGAGFAAILARGEETLPPVARLRPSQAPGWLLLAAEAEPAGDECSAVANLVGALERAEVPIYLLTSGRVGGPPDEPRSREIPDALIARVLDAAAAGQVDWELDPDFGYELPMEVPGVGVEERRVLVPRFLYARTDRVYDYAAMVPRLRRRRASRLASITGVPSAISDAFDSPARRR
jgi:phosphoenolpyruvate carboxykinase (ATP)